jgi:hypothetical protein
MQELVNDSEVSKDAVVFTQKVLDLRKKFMTIVTKSFNSDRLFLQAINQAFEVRNRICATNLNQTLEGRSVVR